MFPCCFLLLLNQSEQNGAACPSRQSLFPHWLFVCFPSSWTLFICSTSQVLIHHLFLTIYTYFHADSAPHSAMLHSIPRSSFASGTENSCHRNVSLFSHGRINTPESCHTWLASNKCAHHHGATRCRRVLCTHTHTFCVYSPLLQCLGLYFQWQQDMFTVSSGCQALAQPLLIFHLNASDDTGKDKAFYGKNKTETLLWYSWRNLLDYKAGRAELTMAVS